MNVFVCIAMLVPFSFYYLLWTYPQKWVDFCGKGTDPCHRMAQISHLLKILQFLAFFSVAHFSWPPWYCFLLFATGQFLNFRSLTISPCAFLYPVLHMLAFSLLINTHAPYGFVGLTVVWVYYLLGESGTYYGVRFGKNIPWVTEFPFGFIRDPQYIGSILSLIACLCWVPLLYILLWILGYLFIIFIEMKENPATRAKVLS